MKTFKILSLVNLLLILFSCSSDDAGPSQKNWDEYEFAKTLVGTYTDNGFSNDVDGYVTIDNGRIVIDVLSGRLVGNTQKQGDNYNITITQKTGAFKEINAISGMIDAEAATLLLSGTGVNSSSFMLAADLATIWEVNRTKAAVHFSHRSGCIASITINGVTLNGLNGHYEQDALCNPIYAWQDELPYNYDDFDSRTLCHTGTITGLDGNPLTFTDCSVARFILDKNTEYTYAVSWSNGETSTGQFTTPGGGKSMRICIANDNECSSQEEGSGQLTFDGTVINANDCMSTENSFCSSAEINLYMPFSGGSFQLYKMPRENSGSFSLINPLDEYEQCELFGIFYYNSVEYVSQSGTITKTGANSFTFNIVVKPYNSAGPTTYNLTGFGTYR